MIMITQIKINREDVLKAIVYYIRSEKNIEIDDNNIIFDYACNLDATITLENKI